MAIESRIACKRVAARAFSRYYFASLWSRRLPPLFIGGRVYPELSSVGMPEGRRAGVGLSSMRERAEELGGTLAVEQNPDGGTRVVARLPLPGEEER